MKHDQPGPRFAARSGPPSARMNREVQSRLSAPGLLFVLTLAWAWGVPSETRANLANRATLRAYVSIQPQAYFVERIGGKRVHVEVLVGPGQSPATYEPTPRQMAGLTDADVFFRIGVPFEQTLLRKIETLCPDLNIRDTSAGIERRPIEGAPCEHDGHEHEHEHSGLPDPHIWLAPKLAKVLANNICAELCRLDADQAGEYRRNCAALLAELDQLDAELTKTLEPLKGREFFVFHPAYGYFGAAYGLRQVPVQIAGREPSAKELAQLIDRAKKAGVKVIFVQPQFSQRNAKAIAAAIGGAVVPLDPLARDYVQNLRDMARKIAAALAENRN
ncbi:MAG: zinc ABC transporter substrate-binding protein [Planctomycetes bacterium]|nr:zinc ABC transporter substrate-binding protein [Planctomycetota bacterium]